MTHAQAVTAPTKPSPDPWQAQVPLATVDRAALHSAFAERPERLMHYVMRSMSISPAELACENRYAGMVREARAQMAA